MNNEEASKIGALHILSIFLGRLCGMSIPKEIGFRIRRLSFKVLEVKSIRTSSL